MVVCSFQSTLILLTALWGRHSRTTTPILQMRKWRLIAVKWLLQDHTDNKQQSRRLIQWSETLFSPSVSSSVSLQQLTSFLTSSSNLWLQPSCLQLRRLHPTFPISTEVLFFQPITMAPSFNNTYLGPIVWQELFYVLRKLQGTKSHCPRGICILLVLVGLP